MIHIYIPVCYFNDGSRIFENITEMKTVEFYISCTTYHSATLSQKWSVSLPEE